MSFRRLKCLVFDLAEEKSASDSKLRVDRALKSVFDTAQNEPAQNARLLLLPRRHFYFVHPWNVARNKR